jgi:hypothetical protein
VEDGRVPARRKQLASTRRVERASGRLATAAAARMAEELSWFRELSAEHRSWVGVVAQAGIGAFVAWLKRSDTEPSRTVFAAAPRELARVVTLQQAVELVRLTVDTVEHAIDELAAPGEEDALRLEVLRFSREIAFSAAQVYAVAAEERGAWHARQQALLLDALVRDEPPESLRARAAALGWGASRPVVPVVGAAPEGEAEAVVDDAERTCRQHGLEAFAGLHGDRLVVVVAAERSHRRLGEVVTAFGDGAVVLGPAAEEVAVVSGPLREALAALRVAAAWPAAPRPVDADALLAERALDGDALAGETLVKIYKCLVEAGGALTETVSAYVGAGGSVEAAARELYLHPNTVRYRLKKAAEVSGHSPLDPRDAFTLQVALALGRLAD